MVQYVPDPADRQQHERTGPSVPRSTVAEVLAALPSDWTVLEDVGRRGSRCAGIDHVVVGPSGLFVIDVQDWSGHVTVVDNVVRLDREARQNDTDRCADAALAVAEVVEAVDGYAEWLLPVLCLARDEPLLDWAVEVRVCTTSTLAEALTSLPPVLSPQLVAEALAALNVDATDAADADALSTAGAPTVPDVLLPGAPVGPSVPVPQPGSRPDRAEITARLDAAADGPEQAAGEPLPPAAASRRRLPRRALTGVVGIAVAALLVTSGPQLFTSLRSTLTDELDGSGGAQTCLPSSPAPGVGRAGGDASADGGPSAEPGAGSAKASPAAPAPKGGRAKAARRAAAARQQRATNETQALQDLPTC